MVAARSAISTARCFSSGDKPGGIVGVARRIGSSGGGRGDGKRAAGGREPWPTPGRSESRMIGGGDGCIGAGGGKETAAGAGGGAAGGTVITGGGVDEISPARATGGG